MSESTPRRHHTSTCAHPDSDHPGACPTLYSGAVYIGTPKNLPARTDEVWEPIEPISLDPDPDDDEYDDEIGILRFHGADIPVLINDRGRWASLNALCDAMGIDGEGQRQNLKRKSWSEGWTCVTQVQVGADVQSRSHLFIHEKRVAMWLANIDTRRLGSEPVRARVEATQADFADALAEYMATGQVQSRIESQQPVSVQDALSKGFTPKDIALLVIAQSERADKAEHRVAELEPAAHAHAAFMDSEGTYYVGSAAKILGVVGPDGKPLGQDKFFALLRDADILIDNGHLYNTPRSEYVKSGYFVVDARSVTLAGGARKASYTTRVTPKGMDWLYRRFVVPMQGKGL